MAVNAFLQKQGQRGKIGGVAAATHSDANKTVGKSCRLWSLLSELLRQFALDRHWTKPRNDPEHRDSLFPAAHSNHQASSCLFFFWCHDFISPRCSWLHLKETVFVSPLKYYLALLLHRCSVLVDLLKAFKTTSLASPLLF